MPIMRIKEENEVNLRMIFADTVLSFNVSANVTLEDIARTFANLSGARCRRPLAIDVTLAPKNYSGDAAS